MRRRINLGRDPWFGIALVNTPTPLGCCHPNLSIARSFAAQFSERAVVWAPRASMSA